MLTVVCVIKATIFRSLCINADLTHSNILGMNKQVKAPHTLSSSSGLNSV